MKKITMLSVMLVFVLTSGLAFAETGNVKKMSEGLYNGITYFEMGPAAQCGNTTAAESGTTGDKVILNNGVTSFSTGMPGSGAKGSCAGGTGAKGSRALPGNGITIFG